MTKNGNTNGYVQVFKGPDGKPMVLLRGSDFAALVNAAFAAENKKGRSDFGKVFARFDWTESGEVSGIMDKLLNSINATSPHIFDVFKDRDTASDEDAYAEVKGAIARGGDEVVPGDMARRLLAGEAPLKVWRKYRGLKQTELADVTGVGQDIISKIENNKRTGDVATIKALAAGLGVLVDDLVI